MTDAPIELLLSAASFGLTCYFWLVQARRERPQLHIYQIGPFRAMTRRRPDSEHRRLCVQQIDDAGVLIANNSSRQNSIVLFECRIYLPDGTQITGDWGTVGEDRPPWNIGPDSTIGMGLACFFDVPRDFETPDEFMLQVNFITASGQKFAHRFFKKPPAIGAAHAAATGTLETRAAA